MAPPPGLGPPSGGLDRRGDCAALGCAPGSGQPVAEEGARRRHRRAHGPHSPGLGPRLSAEQRAQLPALLAYGAEAFGFLGDVWTTKRVAAVIRREFGVRYHPAHVSRLLRACGWSVQKPGFRTTQRDAEAIRMWTEQRWPALQAK